LDSITTDTDVLAPMSDLQRHWWGRERLFPDPSLMMSTMVRVRGALDVDALGMAVRAVAGRHEALRTNFSSVNGRPVQIIRSRPPEPLTWFRDISDVPESEQRAALRAAVDAEQSHALDLGRDPLMKFGIIRRADDDFVLALTLHHIIADGWSVDVQWRDLAREYGRLLSAGPQTGAVDDPPPRMRDWVAREQEIARGPKATAEIEHWRRVLRGVRPVHIPHDLPDGITSGRVRRTRRFTLPPDLCAGLTASAKRFRATPHMIAMAAFMRVLARRLHRQDVAVMTLFNRRAEYEVAHLVGCLLNFAVIAVTVPSDGQPGPLVGAVRSALLDAYENQELCAQRVWQETRFSPASVDVMFIFDQDPPAREPVTLGHAPLEAYTEAEEHEPEGYGPEGYEALASGVKFRLHLADGRLSGAIGYDAKRYSRSFITTFVEAYVQALSETVLDR
jgi:hypothetical protein